MSPVNHIADPYVDRILILDFGSQYTQLIARRIRELGVYCEIQPYFVSADRILEFDALGVILSGGPDTVTNSSNLRADPALYELELPLLGICYGMQTMVAQLGGRVETAPKREYGFSRITIQGQPVLLQDLELSKDASHRELDVWMSHGDRVVELPPGFEIIASSHNAPMAAIANFDRQHYGLQFHPEVTHTPQGYKVLQRFLTGICGCRGTWTTGNVVDALVKTIRADVGSDKVLLGLSGGVDSAVVAALLHNAIGDQLTCIFVDNGLLRLGESDQVMSAFQQHLGFTVRRVDAEKRFLAELVGIAEPEEKRKIIGRVFIEVFQEEASKLDGVAWLAQGTIYPDIIESAGIEGTSAKVIKSHHNVGGLPESLNLKLLEPLSELFKDEVRRIGVELGLSEEMVNRHPFPGPGLGVRILGEVKKEYADILREVDAVYLDELREYGLYDEVSQAFAVFLPVKSVGVVGDNRAYEYVVALRAVESVDFMTATWKRLPYNFLEQVSSRIINEVRGISRVTYDISSKPPATIEWE
jgi:GMP synthase (glutamine-hydrolysing)